jgi:hypothetical protein
MPTSTPVRHQRRRRPPPSPAVCRTCKDTFRSSNALFQHLNESLHFLRSRKSRRSIVASKAPHHKVGTGTAYKDFNYCEVRYQLSPKSPKSESWGCVDTGSGMSLVDESVLKAGAPSSKRTTNSPVHIKGVGDELFLSKESVVLDVFFPDVTNNRLAKITREFHIVQEMECGLLIGNDIIDPEGIVINLAKKKMQISACDNMACHLKVQRKKRTTSNRVVIRCAKETVLRSGNTQENSFTKTLVPIRFPKLDGYHAIKEYGLPSRCYLWGSNIRWDTKEVEITSHGDEDFILPKDYKLGYIELPVQPQYTPVKPVDVVQCHFRKAAEPQEQLRSSTVTNEVATASIGTTSSRQVPKKTSSPCESAPKMFPQSARVPPPSLRSSVPSPPSVSSFPPVHSFLGPLRRSPFFFFYRRPPFSHPLLWQSPLGIPCDCQNVLFFPLKPGWQHRTVMASDRTSDRS